MSEQQSQPSGEQATGGTPSTVGTQFLNVVTSSSLSEQVVAVEGGEGSGSKAEIEPFPTLRADFKLYYKQCIGHIKSLEKTEQVIAIGLFQKKSSTIGQAVLSAIDDGNEAEARQQIQEFHDLFDQTCDELPKIVGIRKTYMRTMTEDPGIGFWQDGLKVVASYKKLKPDLLRAVIDARQRNLKADPNLERIRLLDQSYKTEFETIDETINGRGYLADLVELSEAAEGEKGSVAWFEAIKTELEGMNPPAKGTQQVQPPVDPEWQAIVDDITAKWGAFRDSKFDWKQGLLRGPSIATGLYTQRMRDLLKAGNAYVIGGKRYEVGPSDTGGMSMKTDFPVRYQGYNSKNKWVKSFIYHLQATH